MNVLFGSMCNRNDNRISGCEKLENNYCFPAFYVAEIVGATYTTISISLIH